MWLSSNYYFITFLHFFDSFFFSGQITIRIDTSWVQLLLEFSTDHFKTMHTCSTWSVDVHVVLGLSSHYFYELFLLLQLSFFQVRLLRGLFGKFVEFCYISNNLHPIFMKLGMQEALLILKVFVKNKIKETKKTRYTGCRRKKKCVC